MPMRNGRFKKVRGSYMINFVGILCRFFFCVGMEATHALNKSSGGGGGTLAVKQLYPYLLYFALTINTAFCNTCRGSGKGVGN